MTSSSKIPSRVAASPAPLFFAPLFFALMFSAIFSLAFLSGLIPQSHAAAFDLEDAKAEKPEGAKATSHDDHAKDGHSKDDHAKDDHAGHKGGHHDETDLSHANAAKGLEEPSDVRSDLAIYSLVVFVLLLAILFKFAWKPIMEGLAKREQGILSQIESARKSAAEAEQSLKAYQAKLASAADEVREMVAEARRDAESTRERIVAEAQAAAQKERERALREIQLAKEGAVLELRQAAVEQAFSLATKVVRREIKPEDHSQLVRETLQQVASAKN